MTDHGQDRRLVEIRATWSALLEAEETAFQKCCDLDHENHEKTKQKSEAVRHWWGLANEILWMFTRTRMQYNHELQPFPAFTLGRLANVSEDISNGIIPSFVEDARRGRGRPMFSGERKHIAYGVLYIEAVRSGEIEDRSPNLTVRRAYNVTARAVQGWMKRREEICLGVPFRQLSPEELKKKMLECGEVYSNIGRGAPSDN